MYPDDAVNRAGAVRGNYYNVLTDNNLPVQGAVDKKTQRASWVVGEQKEVVYDTGIANLTKDESPLLIHFGKERTQQWLHNSELHVCLYDSVQQVMSLVVL